MPYALEYEGISKEYRSRFGRRTIPALQNFVLSVEEGEIFGFLGPNGAGKTTAIHLAMGFMRATCGVGRMLGKPFGDVATRRRVGFLAEHVAFYPRSAESVVRFYGGLNDMHGPALRRAVRDVLQAVGLGSESGRNISQFSRGMLQRIGLAQAFVNDPALAILDEPTSALDPATRVAVRELLWTARKGGGTIFLSSHLLSEVELVCDRVAILSRGRVVRSGCLNDLLETADRIAIVVRSVPAGSFPDATADGSLFQFTVARSQLRETLGRVWSVGGEVVSVNPLRRSLEDIFLELTAGANSGGGERG
ncbi:MAG TPA: ABC transporter ATP-binding protein [Terriglobales bacterium]|nr:ABC transporter ATP-binding protein [Terriglobales bacterium]